MERYDLIVIGGGPAGYRAAERAGKEGLKVLLAEKDAIGGVCLNEGCVPSKAFLHVAKISDTLKTSSASGVVFEGTSFIVQTQVVKNKDRAVKRLVAGVKLALKAANVEVVQGEGYIVCKENQEFVVKVGDTKYLGKNLLIATGSSPLLPGIEGLLEGYEKKYVLTNKEVLSIEEIPEKLVVIGGGVIGLEMGSYFFSAGSKVTIIEMLDSVGGPIDAEIASLLRKNLEKKGLLIETGAKVIKISNNQVFFERNGEIQAATFDKVLVSVGRKAVTKNIGLENIGVSYDRGIKTDNKMRTNIKGVYAAGDVTGTYMLAHVAYREADVVVNDILGIEDAMSYLAVPSVIYTSPEVATVGETEESANAKGLKTKTIKISLMFSGRYIAESDDRSGIMKVIYDTEKDTLIGASVIGLYSSEYIGMISSFIGLKIPVAELKKQIYPHPTVSEVFRDALFEI